MNLTLKTSLTIAGGVVIALAAGCSSMKTPTTVDLAVSQAAVDNAAAGGGAQFAPADMSSARDKQALAIKAMADKDYLLASDLAAQAQADAQLAQAKANSTKAQAAADALREDIRVLRDELARVR